MVSGFAVCGPVNLPPDATVQQQPQPVVGKLRKACPRRLTFLMSRFMASVGPLEQPSVAWKARISASHALTVFPQRVNSTLQPMLAVDPAQRARGFPAGQYYLVLQPEIVTGWSGSAEPVSMQGDHG